MPIPGPIGSNVCNIVVPLVKLHRRPSTAAEALNWIAQHHIERKELHYVLTARYRQFSESQEDNYWAAIGALRVLKRGTFEDEDIIAPIFAEYGSLLAEDLMASARLTFGPQLVEREVDIEYVREMGLPNDAFLVSMVHVSESR